MKNYLQIEKKLIQKQEERKMKRKTGNKITRRTKNETNTEKRITNNFLIN